MTSQPLASATLPPRRWVSTSSPARRTSYPVFLLRPPYDPNELRSALPDMRCADVSGTIVGVQVHRPEIDIAALQVLIREQSQRSPFCPVVVLLQLPPEEGLVVASRLAPLRLRAVVPQGPLMGSILRDALTDRATLPRDVIAWLRLRSVRLNSHVADLLERLFTDAPAHATVASLLQTHRIPESTARFRLRKKSLPPPSQWFQLARALHAALRLQAEPDASMVVVARQMNFADHSALAHLLRRSLGVRAREIRSTWGWEWLLHRWLVSRGVLMR